MSVRGMNDNQFSLPLANKRNRQLQNQVREKRDKLARLMFELDKNENLLRVAEQEVSTLEQNTVHSNNLAHNIRNQASKEREVLKLATSESAALEQEARRIQQQLDQFLEHHERQQKQLTEQEQQLERLNRIFEEEAKIVDMMEKMVESQQDDQGILDKYSHQDNMMIKELELKLARAKEGAEEADRQLKAAREERQNVAIQLSNLQEEFRSMTEDRDQNLQRWEATMDQTRVCREQLEQSRKEYQAVKVLANADQNRLDDVQRCIKQMNNDITSLERTLYTRELFASQLKLKLDEAEKAHNEQQAEYLASEKMAKRLSADIIVARTNANNFKQKLLDIQSKINQEQEKCKELEKQLEEAKNTVGTAQAQKKSLLLLAKSTEERLERQKTRLNDLANEQIRTEDLINKAKSNVANIETKIKLCNNSLRHLDNHSNSIKQQMKLREESVYKKNIEILRMELELRRLRSSLGDLHERQTQRQQIEALKKELDVGNSYLVGLKYELSKTQSDLIGLQRTCDLQQQRKNVLEALSQQLQSECSSRERECNDLRRELEEIRMGESLIHLEIKRRESLIQNRSTAIEQLENQKKFIELAIETRRDELAGQMEVLQLENRSLKERTQQLNMEVNQKAAEIDRIKLRHEMVANSLSSENGPHETSEAYFIIKMAQEKELLKESINDLGNVVSKLENDNVALNNTLKLIASCNQQFRQHTIVGVLTDDDKALKLKMEHDSDILEKTISVLRKDAQMEMRRVELLEEEIRKLNEEVHGIKFSVEEKEIVYKGALEEMERLKSKIKRAKELNQQMQKLARRQRKTKARLDEEIDFEISQLRETSHSAKVSMANIVKSDENASTSLAVYLEEMLGGSTSARQSTREAIIPTSLQHKMRLDITDFPLSAVASIGSRGSAGSSEGP